jgi:hypothetical protein
VGFRTQRNDRRASEGFGVFRLHHVPQFAMQARRDALPTTNSGGELQVGISCRNLSIVGISREFGGEGIVARHKLSLNLQFCILPGLESGGPFASDVVFGPIPLSNCATTTRSPSNGPSPQTRSWLPSNAPATKPSRPYVVSFLYVHVTRMILRREIRLRSSREMLS